MTSGAKYLLRGVGLARWKILALAVGIGITVLIGYYAYWALVQYKFTTITEHQIYQSAQMPPDEILGVARERGIRTVIDLRTAEQTTEIEAEREALDGTEVAYFHLPTGDIPDEATVVKFLEIVGDPVNRPVLVHCHHGVGRSVLFSSLFRVEFENWDNEAARREVEPLHWRGNFGPDSAKGRYLLSYKPHQTAVTFRANELVDEND